MDEIVPSSYKLLSSSSLGLLVKLTPVAPSIL